MINIGYGNTKACGCERGFCVCDNGKVRSFDDIQKEILSRLNELKQLSPEEKLLKENERLLRINNRNEEYISTLLKENSNKILKQEKDKVIKQLRKEVKKLDTLVMNLLSDKQLRYYKELDYGDLNSKTIKYIKKLK